MARQSVSKHLAVLEDANLITTVWRGREKLHYLNAEPVNAIADRWINQYDRARVQTLADLKTALETAMSTSPEFVYTTYIRRRTRGSTRRRIEHPEQVILESDPCRRLALAFHTFVPERTTLGLDAEPSPKAATERRSKVSFDIEPVDDGQVKLTVVHDDFPTESTVRELISGGWPWKLANLTSGLEQES